MKLRLILFSALAFFAFACKPTFKTAPNGLVYKLFKKGSGEKAKLDDVMKFQFVMKNSKDSVLTDTYKSGQPMVMKLSKPTFKGDPMEGFAMMAKGDSAVFKIKTDSLYKGNAGRNPFKKGEIVSFYIKMLDIKSQEDYKKDMDKMAAESQQKESEVIEKLVKEKYPTATKTASGLYYLITKPGTGPNATEGDSVTAHYKGMLVSGKVFDTDSGRNESFKFKLGQHMVIPGWDEGFTYLNKGAKAVLIIPSKLAYGSRDMQVIPPNSTLIFEVELVSAKK
jgi:FKBP-type peptidyl-prolyl cis-trans isomerase FkpA